MAAYINDTELRVYIDQSDEMDQFEISMQPEKSVKSSKWAHAKFMKWQSSSVDLVNLKTSEPSDIAESLRAFYFSLQKENRELYPAVTLRGKYWVLFLSVLKKINNIRQTLLSVTNSFKNTFEDVLDTSFRLVNHLTASPFGD